MPTKRENGPGVPRSCSILLCQDGTYYGSERTTPGVPGLSSAARKSGVGLWGGRSRALPRSRFRHRGFAEPRNPRRGGSVEGKTKILVRWLARARCPALRSAGLFGSETGSPRARASLCEVRAFCARGQSESRTRPADLTPRKALQPAGCNKRERTTPFQEGPLPLKITATRKKTAKSIALRGW